MTSTSTTPQAAGAPAADPAAPPLPAAGTTQPVVTDVPARAPWSAVVPAGALLTITDLHGNQAVDFLVYDAHDTAVRYSAPDTVQAQGGVFLTTGSVLLSSEHTPLMTVVADTCGRHDTIGGACSKESNTLRYGHHTWSQHACADNFLAEGSRYGLGKRDLVSNVNWFMNVPVEDDGTLGIVDGISAPGLEVTLRAETDVLVLVSNCPQINNPCNGFDPTPVRMTVTAPTGRAGTAATPAGRAGA
ncbi:urea amidolyase associated protein UAAP2 [Streptomyces sp. HPF1205]|uniref:urea amidolyase associated protein UAAP2 n=1 Tax=Streptomyces sp. HPF1205 TaxID=2873262 RepID=UPI0021F0B6FE